MEGVVVVAELEREEGVLAPGDVGIHVNFVLLFREVGETFTAHAVEVDLRSGGQVDVPARGQVRSGQVKSGQVRSGQLVKRLTFCPM